MRNMMVLAGKEVRSYFNSPIAYLVMTIYAVLCGFFFLSITGRYVQMSFRMMMMGQGAPPVSLNDVIVRGLLEGVLTVVLLLLIPLITMRLYAEEKRSGTMELLLAQPVARRRVIGSHFAVDLLTIPVVSVSAMSVGYMFGWAIIIEQVFNIAGLSRALLSAIFQRDYYTVQAVVLVITTVFVAANLAADVVYRLLDPRIRGVAA